MKDAYLMTAIQCHGCKLMANIAPPTIVASKADMQRAALDVHKGSKMICLKPQLVILYGNVMVSSELVIQKPGPVSVKHNGGDGKKIITS